MRTSIRIGGGQAGYGEPADPILDQISAGIDYLVCDALAESTLAVLEKDRERDERLGFTRDIGSYVAVVLAAVAEKQLKFITNAGGLNPISATAEVVETIRRNGLLGVKVATVIGDDLLSHGGELQLPVDTLFCNAYLGAGPIVAALETGADIVVCGRVADASMFLAPMIYEFGWSVDDWSRIAAGLTIGHLLECSGQVSGAIYSGPWWETDYATRPAYPIGEVDSDGTAVITKPPDANGIVSFDTVREQLLYEIHDPRRYLSPDCVCDFTSVRLTDLGSDRVRVEGAVGNPCPPTYKALYARPAGWMGDAVMGFSWPDAEAKARAVFGAFKHKVDRQGLDVQEWCEEFFGAGGFHGDAAREDLRLAAEAGWEPPEVVARIAWRCKDAETASSVSRLRGGQSMAMASPVGRPKRREPTQLISLHPLLVDRKLVDSDVRVIVTNV